jgi:hypothetical protein
MPVRVLPVDLWAKDIGRASRRQPQVARVVQEAIAAQDGGPRPGRLACDGVAGDAG